MPMKQSRRRFFTGVSLAGAAGLLGAWPTRAAQPGLETTSVRIASVDGICIAPQYVAEELLRAEGFTDVRYVRLAPGHNTPEGIASGEVDFGSNFASVLVAGLDRGIELTVLGGVHVGCFELFVNDATRSLTELKGKRVGITYLGSPGHLFLAAMAAHVGIDPGKDLHWVASGKPVAMELFTEREGRCLPGLSPRAAGAAGAEYRPGHRQQRPRPAVVAIFLLHAGGQPRVRPELSDRDKSGSTGHAQGR